ncbi:MAG: hypothetical protein ACI9UU_002415 [Candidatus Azotimanducaceae bacterium]|jgi:hypothetical protein
MTTRICITAALDAANLGVSLPEEWSRWPTRIELAFDLSIGGAVTGDDYSRFKANSLQDVANFLFDPVYQRRYLRYSLITDGFLPAYRYDAEYSLLRRGSTGGVRRRVRKQGTEPFSWGADTTLLEIWRQPLTQNTFESRIWLRTGGLTENDALSNWIAVARHMRKQHSIWKNR